MDELQDRLRALGLLGLATRLDEIRQEPWLERLIAIESEERQHRGLERRMKNSRLGRFKPIADYDWSWPTKIDREAIQRLFRLGFVEKGENALLVGGIGLGKTMIAKNIAHTLIKSGRTVRFTTASAMLTELTNQDGSIALKRAFRRYTSPGVLVIDELGYLAYGSRHADVLFDVVNQRYELGRSIVVTTNRGFTEWGELFPNATCVVPLVDRLVHHCEVVHIEGESYRLKEARERNR
ncbi:MAG: IS21-like element helper ATPase IstB [Pseudomonadota bacterium]|nr:IS21-like element helper ATPase IstB [Pseudomonadota bacterium]